MSGLRGERARAVERIDDAWEADERVLDHLATLGCDLAEPLESRHFLYLPERTDADAVAEALQGDGWLTSVERSEHAWLVNATRVCELTPDVVQRTRVLLEALASARGGVYDGWEATAH
jgi:Regulator of ribonuclease activity B